MINQEAVIYGVREGLKLGALYMVWSGIFMQDLRGPAFRSLLSGVAAALLLFIAMSLIETGMLVRDVSHDFAGYVFFVFFFITTIVLLRFPDIDIAPAEGPWPLWAHAVVIPGSFVFFAPDFLVAAINLRDITDLKQGVFSVYGSFASGAILVLLVMYFLARRWSPSMGRFFGLAQLLIFLVLIKLLLSGAGGLAEFSLVSTVQRGVMKFVHDLVHQSFLFLLVPDHPMLKITTWNFIGFFFGPDFSITLALCILLIPPFFFLYRNITSPVVYPDGTQTGADRRLVRAEARRVRMHRMVPMTAFILLVAMSWYSSGSEKVMSLYVPEPKPLIEDKGMVMIPLLSPGMNLMDGSIHKFSVLVDGKGVRLLLVRKPDGSLAVTLDACEICPPDGYGQRDSHVLCIYCMTPIPIETLGRPGGCNPIPIASTVTDRDVRIQMEEIRSKWNVLVISRNKGVR
jgi:uncharacterized membrane protein (UPF0136 family)